LIVQQVQKRQLVSLAKIKSFQEGDYISIEENENGTITISPIVIIRPLDIKTLSKDWQDAIKQSKESIANGEYDKFESMEDCIKDLERLIEQNATNSKGQTI
jgi:hypothetical protein